MYILPFLAGVLTGLRCITPTAAVSWAARLGWLPLQNTWLGFLNAFPMPFLFSLFAILELINDKRPTTPSRKAPGPFLFRVLFGALAGAALGAADDGLFEGLVMGALGAVAGTLGGYEFRARLVKATGGKDLPIALLEDAIAIGGSALIVLSYR